MDFALQVCVEDELELLRKDLDEADEFFISSGKEKSGVGPLHHGVDMEIFHLLRPIRNVLCQKGQKGCEIFLKNSLNFLGSFGSTRSKNQFDKRLHLRIFLTFFHLDLNFR